MPMTSFYRNFSEVTMRLTFDVTGATYHELVESVHEVMAQVLPEGADLDSCWVEAIQAQKYGDVISGKATIVYPHREPTF